MEVKNTIEENDKNVLVFVDAYLKDNPNTKEFVLTNIYPSGTQKKIKLKPDEVINEIEYNLEKRWGRAMILNGIVIFYGNCDKEKIDTIAFELVQPKYRLVEHGGKYKLYVLEDEPECLHIIRTGHSHPSQLYFVITENAFMDSECGKCETMYEEEIFEKYKIEILDDTIWRKEK